MKNSKMPKIGLALSGGSGRAIAHIGIIEVLAEHNIPISVITGCSSGSLIAASYACGTLDQLKKEFFRFDTKTLMNVLDFDKEGSGLFNLEKAMIFFEKYTEGKNFEDVPVVLKFLACDVNTGEEVVMELGNLARACQASCAAPGLFAPVKWGNRYLVDGGLFSLIPINPAYDGGADIVIGSDIAATKYIFKKRYIYTWRGINLFRRIFSFAPLNSIGTFFNQLYENSFKVVFYNQSDFFEEELIEKSPGFFAIMAKAMDIASEQHRRADNIPCDVLLAPNVKNLGKIDVEKTKFMYEEGRRVALEAIPEIQRMIREFEWKKENRPARSRIFKKQTV